MGDVETEYFFECLFFFCSYAATVSKSVLNLNLICPMLLILREVICDVSVDEVVEEQEHCVLLWFSS